MSDLLEPAAVADTLALHPDWSFDGETIGRTFDKHDFNGAMTFVNAVAGVAERLDHHPDIALSWNEVTIRTSSHDVHGISSRDFALIAAIEAL